MCAKGKCVRRSGVYPVLSSSAPGKPKSNLLYKVACVNNVSVSVKTLF